MSVLSEIIYYGQIAPTAATSNDKTVQNRCVITVEIKRKAGRVQDENSRTRNRICGTCDRGLPV